MKQFWISAALIYGSHLWRKSLKACPAIEQSTDKDNAVLLEKARAWATSCKGQLDYLMEHFVFIADQRLKILHYYILALGGTAAATLKVFGADKVSWAEMTSLGVIHILTSVIFYMLETRNVSLLDTCKKQLALMEAILSDSEAKVAVAFESTLQKAPSPDPQDKKTPLPHFSSLPSISGNCSYRNAFSIAYSVQLLVGLVCAGLGLAAAARLPVSTSAEDLSLKLREKPAAPSRAAMRDAMTPKIKLSTGTPPPSTAPSK